MPKEFQICTYKGLSRGYSELYLQLHFVLMRRKDCLHLHDNVPAKAILKNLHELITNSSKKYDDVSQQKKTVKQRMKSTFVTTKRSDE